MIKINLFDTPLNTKMVEININEAKSDENITTETIKAALDKLYNENIEILEIKENNATPHLLPDILIDYKIHVKTSKGRRVVLNFACCFIDYEDAKKLFISKNTLDNTTLILKNLKPAKVLTHPLYFTQYAELIIDKFKNTKL